MTLRPFFWTTSLISAWSTLAQWKSVRKKTMSIKSMKSAERIHAPQRMNHFALTTKLMSRPQACQTHLLLARLFAAVSAFCRLTWGFSFMSYESSARKHAHKQIILRQKRKYELQLAQYQSMRTSSTPESCSGSWAPACIEQRFYLIRYGSWVLLSQIDLTFMTIWQKSREALALLWLVSFSTTTPELPCIGKTVC